jgi:hypothetical protein
MQARLCRQWLSGGAPERRLLLPGAARPAAVSCQAGIAHEPAHAHRHYRRTAAEALRARLVEKTNEVELGGRR